MMPETALPAIRARLWRTTAFRLAVAGALVSSVGAGIVFIIIYLSTVGTMSRTLDREIAAEVAEIIDPGTHPNSAAVLSATREQLEDAVRGTFAALIGPSGQIIATNFANPPRAVGWGWYSAPSQGKPFAPGITVIRGLGIKLSDGGVLFIGESATALVRLKTRMTIAFAISFAILLALGLGAGVSLGRGAVRRIGRINASLGRIMAGDFTRRLPHAAGDHEIDTLAASVNVMLARTQALMEDVQHIGNEIAHDLRSPLTRLRAGLELAQEAEDAPRLREAITQAIAQVDEGLELFSALLRLAQIESGTRRAAFTLVDLSSLLRAAAELCEPAADAGGDHFTTAIAPGLTLWGDPLLLTQLFVNLISNALRHTPAGSDIALRAHAAPDRIFITISDNGPGIPATQRREALRRFGRLNEARTGTGVGLGLPIAQAIATLHDGSLTLTDAAPGLRVEIALPHPPRTQARQPHG
ncbi:HAMP domain-containing sensor histidine kinase [Acidocella sp.]|uniref:sensor histidine kinase n=1 Tax=Acidocella sp. TaxID=50710 RepID=UPI0026211D4B|nr:HAMP domain-containing sensor histidine kinase [Acidocella sp.]